jgi:CRISPR-associated protein Cmr1
MRRGPESAPAAAPREPARDGIIREERVYRFLTPVFGGGVRVDGDQTWKKDADPRTPVRVPSIRGQLRFWWRACNPGRCQSSEALFEKEALIFGSASRPSPLSLSVVKPPEPARDVRVLKDRFAVVDDRFGRAYGAFPLRDTGKGSGVDHGVLHEHPGDWTIAASYPAEIADHVEAAFWAWAHFGGLGGRVRRGFGAIAEVDRSRGSLATIDAGWKQFVRGLAVSWPHLPAFEERRLRLKPGRWSGPDAQEFLLNVMRKLRQVDLGRRREADDVPGRHPGRSYWPEPDAIRKLTEQSAPDHRKPVTQVDAFPRAAFGLPIIFHFKDRADPTDSTLKPQVRDKEGKLEAKGRLASPLILRPHRAPDGSIEALAVVLAHPDPAGLVLTGKTKPKREPPPLRWKLTDHEALHLGLGGRPSPLVTLRGAVIADPIDRFLEEIR